MSLDSVNGGGYKNLLVGAEDYATDNNTDRATLNDVGFDAGDGGEPTPVKKSLLQVIKNYFSNPRTTMMSARLNFSAMADRTLAKVSSTIKTAKPDATPTENRSAPRGKEVAVDDSIASHTTAFANGTTQAKLNANIAFIDKMTDGDAKLPSNVKTMIGLSPTLMTHIQNYADAGCTFRMDDLQTEQDIRYDQKDFGDISLSSSKMAANPQEFVSSLAESLVSKEAHALHGLPTHTQMNKDDIIDLERAINDPYGVPESAKNRVDVSALDKNNTDVEMPKIAQELSVVFNTYPSLG